MLNKVRKWFFLNERIWYSFLLIKNACPWYHNLELCDVDKYIDSGFYWKSLYCLVWEGRIVRIFLKRVFEICKLYAPSTKYALTHQMRINMQNKILSTKSFWFETSTFYTLTIVHKHFCMCMQTHIIPVSKYITRIIFYSKRHYDIRTGESKKCSINVTIV